MCKSLKNLFLMALSVVSLGSQASANTLDCCDPCSCDRPWHAYVDFLYWRAAVSGLPFAVSGNQETVPFDFINNQSLDEVRFSFDPGVRLGVGYQFCDSWLLVAEWTRFHTGASQTARGPFLESIWFSQLFGQVTAARANLQSNFDQVRLDFKIPFQLCQNVSVRPSFGAIGGFLHQHLRINMRETIQDALNERADIRNQFNGGGLSVGCDSKIDLCNCLSLYARGSYSILYGQFDLKRSNRFTVPVFTINQSTIEHGFVNAFDINVGFATAWNICNRMWMGQVGWEFMYWPSQVRVRQIFPINEGGFQAVALLGHGDVGYQGLTVRLGVNF